MWRKKKKKEQKKRKVEGKKDIIFHTPETKSKREYLTKLVRLLLFIFNLIFNLFFYLINSD